MRCIYIISSNLVRTVNEVLCLGHLHQVRVQPFELDSTRVPFFHCFLYPLDKYTVNLLFSCDSLTPKLVTLEQIEELDVFS